MTSSPHDSRQFFRLLDDLPQTRRRFLIPKFSVRHLLFLLVGILCHALAGSHLALTALAQTPSLPANLNLDDPQLIGRGSTLFAQSCSVGYCHGIAGKAGRGPRLRGREWDKNYLFKVTYEGIPNSSMPAWKERLTEADIAAVVAYILTLSRLDSDSAEAPVPPISGASASMPSSSASSSNAESTKTTGSLMGDAQKGKALFFDFSNDWRCAACHKVGGAGGAVGPDLSGARSKTVRDLFIDIVLPSALNSRERPLLSITMKSGEQIMGVKNEESPSNIKVYDIGSVPAVLRNLLKDQIQKLEIQNRSAMPANYGEMYTIKQLLDIIAFLKADSGNSQAVSLNDLR